MEIVLSLPAISGFRPTRGVSPTLTQELRNYFNLVESKANTSGYPSISVLSQHWSKGSSGHKILYVADLPPRATAIESAMRQIPARYSYILMLKYGVDRDENGMLVTNRERANYMDLSLGAFNSRLKTARRQIVKKLPDFWPKSC